MATNIETQPSAIERLFSFPDPVNEVAARCVAAGVVVMGVVGVATDWLWVVALLAYGFLARVLTGPTLSPLGQLATRVVVPRLPATSRPVPGPPKRFAQAIGAAFSLTALVLTLLGEHTAARVVLGLLVVAATLESVFRVCLGCRAFALLIRAGLIPETVCARCNNIWADHPAAPATTS